MTAVEIALKQAFQYWSHVGRPQKRRFLHLAESYHGDTLGVVGVGGMELFHRVFGPLVIAGRAVCSPAPAPGESTEAALVRGLDALEQTLAREHGELAAFVVEPLIQGAAGMLVHPRGYLKAAAELCARYEVLLIADEVATGFRGAAGTMFACEQERVSPDFPLPGQRAHGRRPPAGGNPLLGPDLRGVRPSPRRVANLLPRPHLHGQSARVRRRPGEPRHLPR